MAFSKWALPIMSVAAFLLLSVGIYWGLFLAPAEKYMGDTSRIMFIHVPSAWVAMAAYASMAGASFVYLIWRHNLADLAASAMAPVGAVFTFLCLVTGALWGKPTWGAYWVWDARLTSMLVLLFLFIGYMALRAALEDPAQSARAGAILALVGVINLPIIRFSVDWWNTLHQPASLFSETDGQPAMPMEFLMPLLVNGTGAFFLFSACVLVTMRADVLQRRADILMARRIGASG